MSKATTGGEDRANLFKLVKALEDAGVYQAHKIAQLITTMINDKIQHSEGRHHSRFHKTAPTLLSPNQESQK